MPHSILIVDDEDDIRSVVSDSLTFEGFDVRTANSGAAGIEEIKSKSCDLAIVDIRMEGEVTGVQLIRFLNGIDPKPKILVCSGVPKESLEKLFDKEGIMNSVDGILEKPMGIHPHRLGKTVRRFLHITEGAV